MDQNKFLVTSPHIQNTHSVLFALLHLRYTQPPADLIDWYDGFLDDEEVCHPG